MRVRDRLTAATTALMQRHGVAGTGIAEILETSGVTRRSIYLNFPGGKAELVAAATRSAGDQMTAALRECIEQPDPIVAIAKFCSDALVASEFDSGCPIVAAALSRREAAAAADIAVDVFDEWRTMVVGKLMDGGVARRHAKSLSGFIVAAFEGAVILSGAARSTEPLKQVARHLNELLAQYRPAPQRPPRRGPKASTR